MYPKILGGMKYRLSSSIMYILCIHCSQNNKRDMMAHFLAGRRRNNSDSIFNARDNRENNLEGEGVRENNLEKRAISSNHFQHNIISNHLTHHQSPNHASSTHIFRHRRPIALGNQAGVVKQAVERRKDHKGGVQNGVNKETLTE